MFECFCRICESAPDQLPNRCWQMRQAKARPASRFGENSFVFPDTAVCGYFAVGDAANSALKTFVREDADCFVAVAALTVGLPSPEPNTLSQ